MKTNEHIVINAKQIESHPNMILTDLVDISTGKRVNHTFTKEKEPQAYNQLLSLIKDNKREVLVINKGAISEYQTEFMCNNQGSLLSFIGTTITINVPTYVFQPKYGDTDMKINLDPH